MARAAGHPQSADIPLAGLAHLLDPSLIGSHESAGIDRSRLFHRSRAALAARAGDQRLLLVVDDADQLDNLSRALLASLIDDRTIFAAMTMRAERGPLPAFEDLVGSGQLARIHLVPLETEAVSELLSTVLGGPCEPATLE